MSDPIDEIKGLINESWMSNNVRYLLKAINECRDYLLNLLGETKNIKYKIKTRTKDVVIIPAKVVEHIEKAIEELNSAEAEARGWSSTIIKKVRKEVR